MIRFSQITRGATRAGPPAPEGSSFAPAKA